MDDMKPVGNMAASRQCVYMQAAYPSLTASDTCEGFHDHTKPVFSLATELARLFQNSIAMDKVGWFLNDAQAIYGSLGEVSDEWEVSIDDALPPPGVTTYLRVNGVQFVIPDSEWEPAVPEQRSSYLADRDMVEDDVNEEWKAGG